MASQITSLTIVYSTVYSDVDQRKHQSPASLAFVRWTPFNSPHKGPVTRKMFPVKDVIKCGPRIYPGPALKGLMFNWTKNAVEVIDCVEQPHIITLRHAWDAHFQTSVDNMHQETFLFRIDDKIFSKHKIQTKYIVFCKISALNLIPQTRVSKNKTWYMHSSTH